MAVEDRQCDLDARPVERLAVEQRAAQRQARLFEGIAGDHRLGEGIVHERLSPGWSAIAGLKAYNGPMSYGGNEQPAGEGRLALCA